MFIYHLNNGGLGVESINDMDGKSSLNTYISEVRIKNSFKTLVTNNFLPFLVDV